MNKVEKFEDLIAGKKHVYLQVLYIVLPLQHPFREILDFVDRFNELPYLSWHPSLLKPR